MSRDTEAGGAGWLGDEVVSAGLPDKRLARRLHRLFDQMLAAPGQPVPAACDWAATKAAYRCFDNPRITERGVMAGHFAASALRRAKGRSLSCRIRPTLSTAVRSQGNRFHQDHQC